MVGRQQRRGLPAMEVTSQRTAVRAPPAIADAIGCAPGTPAIKSEILSHTLPGASLSYQQIFILQYDRKLDISNSN